MKFIDLTIPFTSKLPVFPGDPSPEIKQIANLNKEGYNDFRLKTGMHVGTHIDAPLHMISKGKRIKDIAVESFFGPGVLIEVVNKKVVDKEVLDDVKLEKGSIVLFRTDHIKNLNRKDYFDTGPIFTVDLAKELVRLEVKIVGIDTHGPDKPPFLTHKELLGNNVLIVENLIDLECLSDKNFDIIALPPKLNTEASPVRVVAIIQD